MSDKTIAQQLKIKQFPFVIKDDNGNLVYHEDSDGYWWKLQYDDANNLVYHEDSYGYWCKKEFDDANNLVYYENSNGYITDKRPNRKAIAINLAEPKPAEPKPVEPPVWPQGHLTREADEKNVSKRVISEEKKMKNKDYKKINLKLKVKQWLK